MGPKSAAAQQSPRPDRRKIRFESTGAHVCENCWNSDRKARWGQGGGHPWTLGTVPGRAGATGKLEARVRRAPLETSPAHYSCRQAFCFASWPLLRNCGSGATVTMLSVQTRGESTQSRSDRMPPTLVAFSGSISHQKTTPAWLYTVPLRFHPTQVSLIMQWWSRSFALRDPAAAPCRPGGSSGPHAPRPSSTGGLSGQGPREVPTQSSVLGTCPSISRFVTSHDLGKWLSFTPGHRPWEPRQELSPGWPHPSTVHSRAPPLQPQGVPAGGGLLPAHSFLPSAAGGASHVSALKRRRGHTEVPMPPTPHRRALAQAAG